MDVLYFLKEEFAIVKHELRGVFGSDSEIFDDDVLASFLDRVELLTKVADDLILPELAEISRRGVPELAEAGDQTNSLKRLCVSVRKNRKLSDAKRKEFAGLVCCHLELMEQSILPQFREEISTQTREDLGLIAIDYRSESSFGLNSKDSKNWGPLRA
ncbi:MAG: hypothetical protein NT027_02810 [Proteobacteria bacterium]|nr:hypothetical protein [Pseudomonadota bacterium]